MQTEDLLAYASPRSCQTFRDPSAAEPCQKAPGASPMRRNHDDDDSDEEKKQMKRRKKKKKGTKIVAVATAEGPLSPRSRSKRTGKRSPEEQRGVSCRVAPA